MASRFLISWRDMELNLETDYADRAYQILASLVTPRPIALVTSIAPDGKINAAPFSFFNMMGANPPICAFAPGDRADGTPKIFASCDFHFIRGFLRTFGFE